MADYYAVLGVPRSATPEEIKKSYRKLARESHPDANPDDPHAEERFKAIGAAYQILSDPEKRQRYDTYGDANGAGNFGGFGDLGDIVDAFFGGSSPFGRQRTRQRTSAVAGQDVGVAVRVTLEEAVFGTKRTIEVQALSRCERCDGSRCEPGATMERCERCGGQGEIRAQRQTLLGTVMTSRPCPSCGGAGEAPSVPCAGCNGNGRKPANRSVSVDLPGGVDDGTTLRVRGQGEQGMRGGPEGDLYVQVQLEPHERFERNGNDLLCELEVPLTQAVLGATVPVETFDGPRDVTIAPGTQHGNVVKLRGLGVTRLDGRGRGDLLVHCSVAVPTSLGDEERALFEQLAAVRGEAVDAETPSLFKRLRDTIRGQ